MAFYRLGNKNRNKKKSGKKKSSSTRASSRTAKGRKRRSSRRSTRRRSGSKLNIPGIGDSVRDLLAGHAQRQQERANNRAERVSDAISALKDKITSSPSTLSVISQRKHGGDGARLRGVQSAMTRATSSVSISTHQASPMVSALANRATGVGSVLQNKTPGDSSPYVVTYLGETSRESTSAFQRDSGVTISHRRQNPFAGSSRTQSGASSTISHQPSSGGASLLGRSASISTSVSSLVSNPGTSNTQKVSIEFPADLELRKTVYVYSTPGNSSLATTTSDNRSSRSSRRSISGNTSRVQISGVRKSVSPSSIRSSTLSTARSTSNSASKELIETITVTEQLQSTSVTLEIPSSNVIVLQYEDGSVLEDFQNSLPSNYRKYDDMSQLERYYLRDFVDQGNYILDVVTSADNPLRSTFNEYTKMYQAIQGGEMMSLRGTSQEDYSILKADWDAALIPQADILTLNASSATSQWQVAKSIVDEADTITDSEGTHKVYRAIPKIDGNYIFDYAQAEINRDESQPGCTFTCIQTTDNGLSQEIDIMFGDITKKTPMVSVRIEANGEVVPGTEFFKATTYAGSSQGEDTPRLGNPRDEQMILKTRFPGWIDIFDVVVRAHSDEQKAQSRDFIEYRETMITYPSLYQDKYSISSLTRQQTDDGATKTILGLKVPFGDLWVPKSQSDPYNREEIEEAVRLKKKVVSLVVTRTDGTGIVKMGPFMINGNLIQQVTDGVATMTFGDVSNSPNITVESVNQSTGNCVVSFQETSEILEAFDAAAPVPDSLVKYYYNLSVTSVGVDYCMRHSGESITRVMTSLKSRRKKLYDPWVFEHPLFLKHQTHAPKRQDIVPSSLETLKYSTEPNSRERSSTSLATSTDMTNALTISQCSLYWLYSVEEESSIFLDIQAHPYLEINVQAEMGIESSLIWAKIYVQINGLWVELAQFHPQANSNKYYDYFTPWWFFLQKECLSGTDTIVSNEIKYQVTYYTSSNTDAPYTNEYTYTIEEDGGQLFSTFGAESAATDGGLGNQNTMIAAFMDPIIGSFSPEVSSLRASPVSSITSLVVNSSVSAVAQISSNSSLRPSSGGFNNAGQASASSQSSSASSSSPSIYVASSRRGGVFSR